MSVSFYFDVISPYAWLAYQPLKQICSKHAVNLKPVPVLFAGLLNHHGQLGPAEIPAKRIWIMKDVSRRATLRGLTTCPPPTHPFNPLLPLRVISVDMSTDDKDRLVQGLLDAVWSKGKDISHEESLKPILRDLGFNADSLIQKSMSQENKDRLRTQTEEAIAAGVFGVPSTVVGKEVFWGSEADTMSHIEAQILGKNLEDSSAIQKWISIKPSAVRPRNK